MHEEKKLTVVFYRSRTGSEPVRDWILGLPLDDRQAIGRDLRLVELGWPIGMPLCRALGGGLWEVRSTLPSRRIARVIFCAVHGKMVLLHGFIKKTQQMPQSDLGLARARHREVEL